MFARQQGEFSAWQPSGEQVPRRCHARSDRIVERGAADQPCNHLTRQRVAGTGGVACLDGIGGQDAPRLRIVDQQAGTAQRLDDDLSYRARRRTQPCKMNRFR